MKELRAEFNVRDFENYGSHDPYLSQEQLTQVNLTENRVDSQLDWLGQLLGWRGDGYWEGLVSAPAQKRQLMGGTFGVYNGFLYPEVLEIQNWNNSVTVKADSRILAASVIYLGESEYKIASITQDTDKYVLSFDSLPDQFFIDLANNEQVKVTSVLALPPPFYRPEPGSSADGSFLCEVSGGVLTLYPSYDTEKKLPYRINFFVQGSRYFFDKPVYLDLPPDTYILTCPSSGSNIVKPNYDFSSQKWYLDIPTSSSERGVGLSGILRYESSCLEVSIVPWEDPSDWVSKNIIENFRGVWNNKGGKLPFHFVFDSLNIHGFDERKSVMLPAVLRSISFDQLLDFVYFQKIPISPIPPKGTQVSQVWWDSQNGAFSVYSGDPLNCGPWVETIYPMYPEEYTIPDYVFPTVASFTSFTDPIAEGCVVRIENINGLNPTLGIEGVTNTINRPGEIDMFKKKGSQYWTIIEIREPNEAEFSLNSYNLPYGVPVKVTNAKDVSPYSQAYSVANLKFLIDEELPLLLMKEVGSNKWYIAPPSPMKYIGNTRLFASSLDYAHPVEGEMSWDYSNLDYVSRSARTFYYDNWVFDPLQNEYILEGSWVNINEQTPTSTVPQVVNFGAIKVYCNQSLVNPGESYSTPDFQFSYTVNGSNGQFEFSYVPLNYDSSVVFPKVTISDSLTSAFTYDISLLIFSGLQYYMSPNVLDSETLLRIWKTEKLSVVDSLSELELLRNSNPLVADKNNGPADLNWERYFVRLPPSYGRNESIWQKVNLVCQDFAYWGSPVSPEMMTCPPAEMKPRIYESVHLYGERPDSPTYLYSEPYLFSDVAYGTNLSDDFENSFILPSYDQPFDDFEEAALISYDPLHTRQADVVSQVGRGYGEWLGGYYRAAPCYYPTGFLVNDLLSNDLEPVAPPVWDSSVYKLPPVCSSELTSSTVDANHFKIGYAFFAADLSAAEDGVFDLGRVK